MQSKLTLLVLKTDTLANVFKVRGDLTVHRAPSQPACLYEVSDQSFSVLLYLMYGHVAHGCPKAFVSFDDFQEDRYSSFVPSACCLAYSSYSCLWVAVKTSYTDTLRVSLTGG